MVGEELSSSMMGALFFVNNDSELILFELFSLSCFISFCYGNIQFYQIKERKSGQGS